MRKLITSAFLSVDGLMSGPAGGMDWAWEQVTDALVEDQMMQYESVDSFLLGRVTYDALASHFPQANPSLEPMTDIMNGMNKIVFSRTLTPPLWQNSRLVKTDLGAAVKKLKAGRGQDLMVIGSASIVQALTALDLIDEYRFYLIPVALGAGKSLFANTGHRHDLQLLHSDSFGNGVVRLDYRPLAR